MKRTLRSSPALVGVLVVLGAVAFAGPINPPAGPVASTYKTLNEVEPRTPVQSLAGSATAMYVITQPGSYYLAANIVAETGKSGVVINAPRVTLDLNGFSIQGDASPNASGVFSTADYSEIGNGSIVVFGGYGVHTLGNRNVLKDIRIADCSLGGIYAGSGSVVADCEAFRSGVGFRVLYGNIFRCSAKFGTVGFDLAPPNLVQSCTAIGCTSHGFSDHGSGTEYVDCWAHNCGADGFNCFQGSKLTNCTARSCSGNGFTAASGAIIVRCAATFSGGHGFQVGDNSVVQDSLADMNSGDGFRASNGVVVKRCSTTSSRIAALVPAGFHLTGNSNIIDECTARASIYGVLVDSGANRITRTTCKGNNTNWSVAAGNYCYVIWGPATSGVINGNSGGTPANTSDPEANFTY